MKPTTIEEFRSSKERTDKMRKIMSDNTFDEAIQVLAGRAKAFLHRTIPSGMTSGEAFYEARAYDRAMQDLFMMTLHDSKEEYKKPNLYEPDEEEKHLIVEG